MMVPSTAQEKNGVTGWDRLGNFVRYMLAPHDPDDPMPPAPEQLVEVSKYTLSSAAAGAVLQALMQYIVERRRGPLRPPQEGMKKKDALTAMAAEQRRRIEQVLRAALKGGMRVGSVSALFFSVQLGTSIYRARQDYYNATCGGMAAGGLMGISGILGAALGGCLGLPVGILQDLVEHSLPEDVITSHRRGFHQTMEIAGGRGGELKPFSQDPAADPVGDVIRQLELRARPCQSEIERSQADNTSSEQKHTAEKNRRQRWWFW